MAVYAPPEYVKQASHEQRCGSEALPPHCYADQRRRLYPCHTAAATWLSSAFFLDSLAEGNEKRASISRKEQETIARRLAEATRYFGIAQDLVKLANTVEAASVDDEARLPDEAFAYVQTINGKKERHLPLRNANEIQKAAEWFGKYRRHFSYEDRQHIAQRILERADSFRVGDLPQQELLEKTAGFGYCPADEVARLIERHALAGKRADASLAAELRKLAELVRQNPPEARDCELRVKIATLLDQFDRKTGLDRLYDESFGLPEDTLFQITAKVASDFASRHVSLTNGSVYDKQTLGQIPENALRQWMGDEFVDEVSGALGGVDIEKLAALAASLPRDDADLFDQMVASVGLQKTGEDIRREAPHTLRQHFAEIALCGIT